MGLCRGAAERVTDVDEGALPFGRALLVRFHLAVCPYCRAYKRQIKTTVAALSRLEPDPVAPEIDSLLDELHKQTSRP